MADYDDTVAFPAYSGATAKRDILRDVLKEVHTNPRLLDIINRINRTDLTGVTDGATNYSPVDSFESAE